MQRQIITTSLDPSTGMPVCDGPLLRKCTPIKPSEDVSELVQDLLDTCTDKTAGVSAPQIGVLRRVAAIRIEQFQDNPLVMINPVITSRSGLHTLVEGCVSLPGLYFLVRRPKKVKVKYRDTNWVLHTLRAHDYLAQAVCHEVDHLDGILVSSLGPLIPKEELEPMN